jgi:transcriptional regulator with XRE-family HTH domain
MKNQNELARWLTRECEKRNLSWTEASRRAGVAPNTVSQIVNGTPAGIKRLTALADFFSVPLDYVLKLAGHLPITENTMDPALQATADQLVQIYFEVKEIDPELAERLTRTATLQAELVLAAARSQEKHQERKNTNEGIKEPLMQ